MIEFRLELKFEPILSQSGLKATYCAGLVTASPKDSMRSTQFEAGKAAKLSLKMQTAACAAVQTCLIAGQE